MFFVNNKCTIWTFIEQMYSRIFVLECHQWLQFNGMVMPSMNEGDVLMITAGKYLELLPGYEAQLGAEVEYEIEPCNSAALEND